MRRPSVRILLCFVPILIGSTGARSFAEDKVILGYLFGPARNLNYKLYTHLAHSFVTADGDGTIRPNRGIPDRKLTSEAHAAGVKVLIAVGGWGWDEQFAAIVSKPDAEARYVASVLKIVKDGDYDGIDIDWEYPDTKEEVVGFERLARTLRRELDAIGKTENRKMLLTFASSSNEGTLKWLRKEFVIETLDWVNVMTYDMAGDWTSEAGHHSPLYPSSKLKAKRSSQTTIDYLLNERGFPPDRLALGIPLYGKGFNVAKPYDSTKGAPRTRLPRGEYSNLVKLRAESGWTRFWDDETKSPWLISPDNRQVIGYDDVESARLKTKWAVEKKLRGIFYWQVNGDRLPDGSNPVQEAVRAGIPR